MVFGHKRLGPRKTGWGGARPGSGGKPKPKTQAQGLVVFPGGREVNKALAEPPAGLPEPQAVFWRQWAPLALDALTLSTDTAPAFALLCELEVKRRAIGAVLDAGEPSPAGLRIFAQFSKQVEGLMGRFCLAPFGKPVVADKPKPAANPFAALGVK